MCVFPSVPSSVGKLAFRGMLRLLKEAPGEEMPALGRWLDVPGQTHSSCLGSTDPGPKGCATSPVSLRFGPKEHRGLERGSSSSTSESHFQQRPPPGLYRRTRALQLSSAPALAQGHGAHRTLLSTGQRQWLPRQRCLRPPERDKTRQAQLEENGVRSSGSRKSDFVF